MSVNAHADKVVVITGAAGDIGYAIAKRLWQAGARVALLDRDRNALQARVEQERAERGLWSDTDRDDSRVLLLACDVADADSTQAAVAAVTQQWQRLDILVNNAATVTPSAKVTELTLECWREALDVNLTGAWLMSKWSVPVMAAQGAGVILNISSQLGHVAAAGRGAYGASKAGLMALTRAIAVDHADDGIRCLSLSPGAVLTGRVITRYGSVDLANQALAPKYPAKRLGTIDEVAETAYFLVGDGAAFITGTDVLADGGYTTI